MTLKMNLYKELSLFGNSIVVRAPQFQIMRQCPSLLLYKRIIKYLLYGKYSEFQAFKE
jgi:hypothetical protein